MKNRVFLVLSSQSFEGDEVLEGVLLDRVQLVVGQTPAKNRVAETHFLWNQKKKNWQDPEAGEALEVGVVDHRQVVALQVAETHETDQMRKRAFHERARVVLLGPIDASPPEPERTRLIALERSQSQDSPKRASAPGNAAAKH